MSQPLPPTAPSRRWTIASVILAGATAIAIAVYMTDLFASPATTWLMPRVWQITIYMLAIATSAVWAIDRLMRHIDRRVDEAASRMDRRVDAIGRCIGARLEENTGELKRVQADVQLDGYAAGYADGLARAPITGVAKVSRIIPR